MGKGFSSRFVECGIPYSAIFDARPIILETLKKRGVVLGVISNWDSRLISTLENIGIARFFDFILPSAVVGSAKPDKKIFEEALRRSGVAPHEACHIGDEMRTDVTGAEGVGIHPILLDRDKRFDLAGVTRVASFLELNPSTKP